MRLLDVSKRFICESAKLLHLIFKAGAECIRISNYQLDADDLARLKREYGCSGFLVQLGCPVCFEDGVSLRTGSMLTHAKTEVLSD